MTGRPITLLKNIAEGARRRLFLASHIVLDDEVPGILRAARSRGVSVRLFTEIADRDSARPDGGLRIRTGGLDGQYSGKDFARHDATLRQLAREGVQIQSGPVFSHLKLWVADGRSAATGSVNLTRNSLGTGPNPSVELMQIFDGELASALAAVFAWLWDSSNLSCDFDASSGFRVTQRLGKSAPPPQHPSVVVGVPGSSNAILDAYVEAIARARQSVTLCTMSAYGWSDLPGFEAALVDALERDVTVTLVRRTPDVRSGDCPSVMRFSSRGMRIVNVPALHAKGVVVDDAWTSIFTGNLNPFSLAGSKATDHIELAVIDTFGVGPLAPARQQLMALAQR